MTACIGRGRGIRALAVVGLALAVSPVWAGSACHVGTAPYDMTVADGSSITLYSSPSVPKGGSCDTVAVSAPCADGVLQGAAAAPFAGCLPLEDQIGLNINGLPGQFDPRMVDQTGAHWVRAFVDVVSAKAAMDAGQTAPRMAEDKWQAFISAGQSGTAKTILSLKWDFMAAGQHPPLPGSPQEQALFDFLDTKILDRLNPGVSILISGNEPFVNTFRVDWKKNPAYGGIPLVVFYERVTAHVNDYLIKAGLRDKEKLFVGAFNRLDLPELQRLPSVRQLLEFADKTPYVDGVDLHTHVERLDQISAALDFTQSLTSKPIFVTEFTYVRGMQAGLAAGTALDAAFAQKWNLPDGMTEEDFLRCKVFHRGAPCRGLPVVPKAEWDDFIQSRPWFIDHFLLKADAIFKTHHVYGSTYGAVEGAPPNDQLKPDGTPWYLGFVYSLSALGRGPDGMPLPNYQYLDDMRQLTGAP